MKKRVITIAIVCMLLSACTGGERPAATGDGIYGGDERDVSADQSGLDMPPSNTYKQYMRNADPSVADLEELFYQEIDADRDGYTEIIAAYGEDEDVKSSFVLRDKDGTIQLVDQNFHTEGYSIRSIQLAQFTGSDQYYIIADVTNYASMNGLSIYKITDREVERIAGASSPSGRGLAYLSDHQGGDRYGGFTVHRDGSEVYYYDITSFYQFRNGIFVPLKEEAELGAYPDHPVGVVVQYLSMRLLYQRYPLNDILLRFFELRDTWVYFYIDEPAWGTRIAHYQMGIDAEEAPGLSVEEEIDGDTAVVTVSRTGRNNQEIHHVEFSLSRHEEKWQITDVKESVEIHSEDGSLWLSTSDINQVYEGPAGFAQINLRLPQLNGDYRGIAEINRYYSKDAYLFDHFGFADMVNDEDFPPDTMRCRDSNHHFSAWYYLTARKGDLISFMAYTDGGAGGTAWDGMRGDTFDITTGKRLELSDLFCVGEEEYLAVIYEQIAEQASANIEEGMIRYSASPYWFGDVYSEEGMNLIKSLGRNDFYLTEDGLVFFYPKYQLAAGGAGVQTFSISYNRLTDLLIFD